MRRLTVGLLLLLAGCTGRPDAGEVEPDMTAAVRSVVGEQAEIRRELLPRCGPTDERLDGTILQLSAETDDHAPSRADLEDPRWTTQLRQDEDGTWRVTVRAEVDSGSVRGPLAAACG